jgi:hypothetical protein
VSFLFLVRKYNTGNILDKLLDYVLKNAADIKIGPFENGMKMIYICGHINTIKNYLIEYKK